MKCNFSFRVDCDWCFCDRVTGRLDLRVGIFSRCERECFACRVFIIENLGLYIFSVSVCVWVLFFRFSWRPVHVIHLRNCTVAFGDIFGFVWWDRICSVLTCSEGINETKNPICTSNCISDKLPRFCGGILCLAISVRAELNHNVVQCILNNIVGLYIKCIGSLSVKMFQWCSWEIDNGAEAMQADTLRLKV